MGIARDIFEILDQGVDNFEDSVSQRFKSTDNTASSLSRKAAEGTLQFPLLVSKSISYETAGRIGKATETNAASFTQIVLTMNPEMDISNDKGAAEYIKKFHTNIDTTDDVFNDAMRFANDDKTTESYFITKFVFLDNDKIKVLKEELKEYGIDWRYDSINEIVEEKLVKDNLFKHILTENELHKLLQNRMEQILEAKVSLRNPKRDIHWPDQNQDPKEYEKKQRLVNNFKKLGIDIYDNSFLDHGKVSVTTGTNVKGKPTPSYLYRDDNNDNLYDDKGNIIPHRSYDIDYFYDALIDYSKDPSSLKDPYLEEIFSRMELDRNINVHYDSDFSVHGVYLSPQKKGKDIYGSPREFEEEIKNSNDESVNQFDVNAVDKYDFFKEEEKGMMVLVDSDGKEINKTRSIGLHSSDIDDLVSSIPKNGRLLYRTEGGNVYTVDSKGYLYAEENIPIGKWKHFQKHLEREKEKMDKAVVRGNNIINRGDSSNDDIDKKKKNNIYSAIAGPDVVGRSKLTRSDMEKLNDLQPILIKVTVIAMDRSSKGDGVGRTFSFVIGVKATVHGIDSEEMIEQLVEACRYHDEIFRFIRWTTGEINFFGDFLLNLKDSKKAISKEQGGGSPWWNRLHRMRTLANFKKRMFMKNRLLPNTSIAITMNEVDYIKNTFGFDLMQPRFVEDVMNKYFLLCFIVVDEALEVVHFKYDGQKSYQSISFTGLDRQNADKAKDFRDILKLVNKTN